MKWFASCTTINEVKALYKKLALENHPDRGGDTATMQAINAEYAFAVARIAKGDNLSSEEINSEIEQSEAYRDAINAIINLEGITIEVVGAWIWVTGNTYAVKDTLKGAGFYFASKKAAWYFRTDEFKVKSRKNLSLDQIRAKYGSKVINTASKFQSIEN